ncbi:MAG: DUF3179 domain-containing (seleno)protein [bacterium]
MGNTFFSKPTEAGRRRLWVMYHVVFALLLIHFIAVHVAPDYMMVGRGGAVGVIADSTHSPRGGGAPSTLVMERDGQKLLWGGEDESMHFDITRFQLDPDRLNYGLGREAFPALIEPEFVSAEQADAWLEDGDRVLVVKVGDEVKAYSIDLLTRHEVVNDTVGGEPIFAAYCILADLGAVYSRTIKGHTLTFALSGYTYADPEVWDGMDAFVLWDRDTESLWWPPIGEAVSGPLMGTSLPLMDEKHWSQTTWGEVKAKHPSVRVLERGQDMERPTDWPKLKLAEAAVTQPADSETATQAVDATEAADARIAPRWGENRDLAE